MAARLAGAAHEAHARDGFWRGALVGLAPLGGLAVVTPLALGVIAVGRQLAAGGGFPAQQRVAVAIAGAGLLVATAGFVGGGAVVLRRAGRWRRAGEPARANGALAALALSALFVALPVLLAVVIPQHPAR